MIRPSLLLPSLFTSEIALVLNNTYNESSIVYDNGSYFYTDDYYDQVNYWQLKLTATFDSGSCGFGDTSTDGEFTSKPGYANLKIYNFNESSGARDEIFDVSFIQTKCPNKIEVYFQYPTYYNPLIFLSNCSQVYHNYTYGGYNNTDDVYFNDSQLYSGSTPNTTSTTSATSASTTGFHFPYGYTTQSGTQAPRGYWETVCLSNDLIIATPFIVEWSDLEYDYLFKPNYFFSNLNYSSGMTYHQVHVVVDPTQPQLWLLDDDKRGRLILLLLFPICGVFFSLIVMICNFRTLRKRCCDSKVCDLYKFVLDGSDIRNEALEHIKIYNFDDDSNYRTKLERKMIDKKEESDIKENTSFLQNACNRIFLTFAVVIILVYGFAILETYGKLNNWQVFEMEGYIVVNSFRNDLDAFFFPTFTVFLTAIILSTSIWIYCVCCGPMLAQYGTLNYKGDKEEANKLLGDSFDTAKAYITHGSSTHPHHFNDHHGDDHDKQKKKKSNKKKGEIGVQLSEYQENSASCTPQVPKTRPPNGSGGKPSKYRVRNNSLSVSSVVGGTGTGNGGGSGDGNTLGVTQNIEMRLQLSAVDEQKERDVSNIKRSKIFSSSPSPPPPPSNPNGTTRSTRSDSNASTMSQVEMAERRISEINQVRRKRIATYGVDSQRHLRQSLSAASKAVCDNYHDRLSVIPLHSKLIAAKYDKNEAFVGYKHAPFLACDACFGLLNVFMFTLSYVILFFFVCLCKDSESSCKDIFFFWLCCVVLWLSGFGLGFMGGLQVLKLIFYWILVMHFKHYKMIHWKKLILLLFGKKEKRMIC